MRVSVTTVLLLNPNQVRCFPLVSCLLGLLFFLALDLGEILVLAFVGLRTVEDIIVQRVKVILAVYAKSIDFNRRC